MCLVCCTSQHKVEFACRLTHHVEDSHDEDEGGGGHGQGETRPRLIRNDDGESEKPEPRGRSCLTAMLNRPEEIHMKQASQMDSMNFY